ncbi:MAG TPA: tRNA dihydrouridine synthase DusB [Candidatus Omnitrophota bacterium]|nr:tRNA dihydrouridine synthase DusB [Candidatus Omnitrophota bacterium]HOX09772.1 tRNA dihydrouridine synthase DusB [Candidatus Omnitrophota bacterium]HPN66275.1 tRNA dihydrouridine synthase DusB [Candidatus Omnitrophota bacterium]
MPRKHTLSLPKLVLAPMAGISDLPYRMLNRKFGAEFAFTEMVNARSLSYNNVKALELLGSAKGDRPLGVQLVGNEPEYINRAIEKLHKFRFDLLDFNAACPERKVVAKGEGAALLKDLKKLKRILKIFVRESKWPVTVKLRGGWDKNTVNARDAARCAEDAGVAAIFIHGRTRNQLYSGTVDYGIIKEVKGAVKVPVIGSGDVLSGPQAKKMFDETGCDGILIARGALGNPWIFAEIEQYLARGTCPPRPSKKEVTKTMAAHLNASIRCFGAKRAVPSFRKFFAWYTRGLDNVRQLRVKACFASTKKEMLAVIKEIELNYS